MSQIEGLDGLFKSSQGFGLAGLDVGLDLVHLFFELRGLGGEGVLVHGPGQVGVQQTLVHGLEVGLAAAQGSEALLAQERLVLAGLDELVAEPLALFFVLDPQGFEVGQDGLLELVLSPADDGVVLIGVDVGAAVVDVLVDDALLVAPVDTFGGDAEAAVGAGEHVGGQVVVHLVGAAVFLLQQALAQLEGLLVDDRLVLADEELAAELDQAGVVGVVEDVRDGVAVEARLAGAVDETLALHEVADLLEGSVAGGVEFKDAADGPGALGVGLDGTFAVGGDVEVAVGGQAGGPALADALLDALEHLLAQVVGVVLGDGGHDVERQGAGRAGPELVLDEGELDAVFVLEFLHPHRVAHVAADAVELVGQDDGDLLLAGVGHDPLEHLVEGDAFSPSLGRLGHDELADDVPIFPLGFLAGDAQLGVDGVALALLA